MRKIIFTMLPLFFVFLLTSCPGGDKGREYRQLKNVQATLSKVGTAGQENTVNVKASLDNEKGYL